MIRDRFQRRTLRSHVPILHPDEHGKIGTEKARNLHRREGEREEVLHQGRQRRQRQRTGQHRQQHKTQRRDFLGRPHHQQQPPRIGQLRVRVIRQLLPALLPSPHEHAAVEERGQREEAIPVPRGGRGGGQDAPVVGPDRHLRQRQEPVGVLERFEDFRHRHGHGAHPQVRHHQDEARAGGGCEAGAAAAAEGVHRGADFRQHEEVRAVEHGAFPDLGPEQALAVLGLQQDAALRQQVLRFVSDRNEEPRFQRLCAGHRRRCRRHLGEEAGVRVEEGEYTFTLFLSNLEVF